MPIPTPMQTPTPFDRNITRQRISFIIGKKLTRTIDDDHAGESRKVDEKLILEKIE